MIEVRCDNQTEKLRQTGRKLLARSLGVGVCLLHISVSLMGEAIGGGVLKNICPN